MGPTAIMSILVAEYAYDPWLHGEDGEETVSVILTYNQWRSHGEKGGWRLETPPLWLV